MKYRTKELDIAMLLLPQDGKLGTGKQISDKNKLGIYNYLKSKRLVTLNYKDDNTIQKAGLTDEGLAFINKGGFMAEEFNQIFERQREKEIQAWKVKARKIVLKKVFLAVLIGTFVGTLVGALVQYYFHLM